MNLTTSLAAIERVVARLESKAHGAQCVDIVECAVHTRDAQLLLCIDKHTQMTTADPRLANAALRELDMHLTLQQQQQQQRMANRRSHVVQLHGYRLDGERLHLFQEFCAHGDLLAVVRHDIRMEKAGLPVATSGALQPSTRSEDGVRRIFAQTLAGVAELHRAGIAHLDLSLENVFLAADGHVRVGDLGLAERFQRNGMGQVERQCPQSVAKVVYAAPEMHVAFAAGIPIDVSKADAWALGVMLWQLWTKQPLFQTATRDDPLFRLMERSGSVAALASRSEFAAAPRGLRDLLARLLCVDPLARLSVQDAQHHPWLCTRVALTSPSKLKLARSVAPAADKTAAMVAARATPKAATTKSSALASSSSHITSISSSSKPTNSHHHHQTRKVRSGSYGGEIALETTRVSIRRSVTASAASSERTSSIVIR